MASAFRRNALQGWRRGRTVLLVVLFLVPVGIAGWWTLQRIEALHRRDLRESLRAVVAITHEGLELWAEDKKAAAKSWGAAPAVRSAAARLLSGQRTPEALRADPAAASLQQVLTPVAGYHDFSGYLLVAPDGTQVAADIPALVGQRTLIELDPGVIEAALRGETDISPPKQQETGQTRRFMVVAAPVRGEGGEVIGALVFRLDPAQHFTRVAHLGRFGRTGETYAFDRSGRMITESRFEEQLHAVGLLGPGESSILSIELRDPGVDLTEGGTPDRSRSQQPLTRMAASALAGLSGSDVEGYRDYRGVTVVGAWLWDEDLGIGLATELDKQEAFQSIHRTQLLGLWFIGVTVAGALILAWILDQRARALHDALNARDDFLTVAAHELKTPLTVLQLLSQRMIDAATHPDRALPAAKLQEMSSVFNRQVHRLNKLLEALVDVAQFREAPLQLHLAPVELGAVVNAGLRELKAEIAAQGSPIQVSTRGELTGTWDRARLEQVIVHLLSNALKFGEGRPIEISVEGGKDTARLSVRDQGIGIDPRAQQVIFRRFGRAVSARHFGGLGLGLFRVRQIVEAHGGTLQVESAPGAGAKFTVELPLQPRLRPWMERARLRLPATSRARAR